jgi:hypothetical protein
LEEYFTPIFRVEEYAKQETITWYLLHDGFLLGVFSDPEDEVDMFLRNVY